MEAVGYFALGSVAWLAAFFAPPFIALFCRHHTLPRPPRWAIHLMFAPAAFAVEWVCIKTVFFAAHDDGSGPPGMGLVVLLPSLMFLGSVATYYAALAYCGAQKLRLGRNVH